MDRRVFLAAGASPLPATAAGVQALGARPERDITAIIQWGADGGSSV